MTKATRAAGINRGTAYKRREVSSRFAAAWDRHKFVDKFPIGHSPMFRAVHGERKFVFRDGVLIQETRTYSPKLIIQMLKSHLPERYTFSAWRKGGTAHEFGTSGAKAWEKLQKLAHVVEERPRWAMRFLDVLRETGCVLDASRVVGVSSSTAYRLRERAPVFAAAWDEIMGKWCDDLEEVASRIAHGWDEVVLGGGGIRQRRMFSTAMTILMMKALLGYDDGSISGTPGVRTGVAA